VSYMISFGSSMYSKS